MSICPGNLTNTSLSGFIATRPLLPHGVGRCQARRRKCKQSMKMSPFWPGLGQMSWFSPIVVPLPRPRICLLGGGYGSPSLWVQEGEDTSAMRIPPQGMSSLVPGRSSGKPGIVQLLRIRAQKVVRRLHGTDPCQAKSNHETALQRPPQPLDASLGCGDRAAMKRTPKVSSTRPNWVWGATLPWSSSSIVSLSVFGETKIVCRSA